MGNRSQRIGIALIVIGALVIFGRNLDLGNFAWPLFVVLPGVVMLVMAFLGGDNATGLAIPGSVMTTIGLVLFVQNLTGYFQSWAYVWSLIVVAAGVGIFLQSALTHDNKGEREGLRVATVGLVLFAAFGSLFEFVIFDGLSSTWLGRWMLPLALIIGGLVLLARRSPKAP